MRGAVIKSCVLGRPTVHKHVLFAREMCSKEGLWHPCSRCIGIKIAYAEWQTNIEAVCTIVVSYKEGKHARVKRRKLHSNFS